MKFLLNYLDKIGRKRTIYDRDNNKPYLERYYLLLKNRKTFPFNIFLHKFIRGDSDPYLHNHPFPYFTLILKGGYYEWLPLFDDDGIMYGERKVWRKPGHFRFCKADSFHRIQLKKGVKAWTLFIPGPQLQDWGFMLHEKWKFETLEFVDHRDYFKIR